MTIRFSLILVALFTWTAAVHSQTVNDPDWIITTHASGFNQPTGMRFVDSSADAFFVIEKATGRVRHYDRGALNTALDLDVNFASERGLLGLEIDPDFAANNRVYVYYSATDTGDDTAVGNWTGNVLARYEWNGSDLTNPTVLMNIADNDPTGSGPNHDGGPLRFGPDGKLYVQLGDLNRDRAEQNIDGTDPASSNVGGIARIDPDTGAPAEGNPFLDHANAEFHQWFSYGHRNGFGMAFDPVTGDLWVTENGPGSYDEINRTTPGQNSGWKLIMGPDDRDAQGNFDASDLVDLSSTGSTYSEPEFSWLETVGVTAIQFLAGTQLESMGYDDAILVGDNNTGRVYLFRLDGTRQSLIFTDPQIASDLVADDAGEVDSVVFGQDFGVMTDLVVGPDQALYAVSLSNGDIYRIVPEPTSLALLGGLGGLALIRRRSV